MGTTLVRIRDPFLLAFAALVVHALPFLLYSSHPLGYDTGFYRRYLTQPFTSFPNAAVPGLGTDALLPRVLLDTLRAFSVPTDIALYGSYIVFFTLLPMFFYYWLRPYLGARGALIGGMLLALSPVGYTAFWYMLYKNAFALLLVLLAFITYERRQFWPVVVLDVAIALSHKTSAIIYLTTLGMLLLVDRTRWKESLVHGFVTGSCVLFLLLSSGSAVSPQSFGTNAVAVFLNWSEYLTFSLPLGIAAGVALLYWREITIPKTLLAFALASFAFPVLRLPFYERIFVFTDLALVAFAAYGIQLLLANLRFDNERWTPYGYFVVLCIITGLHVGNLQSRVTHLQPLVTPEKLGQIAAIGTQLPPDSLLLTSNFEAPWYEGWTLSHIAAPGMLHDTHNYEEWVQFWESTSTPYQITYLNTYPKPLYVSTLADVTELINTPPSCLTKISVNLLRNDCEWSAN